MEMTSVDPYEQKLYSMFNSFDTHSIGSLDKESLVNLCSALELKERGPELVARLIHGSSSRITFKQFKEGLLNLLAVEDDIDSGIHNPIEKSFYETNEAAALSKSREVSPKLVVAGKKYGRRSRPQNGGFDSLQQSDSDDDDYSTKDTKSQTVQRSASQNELHTFQQKICSPKGSTKLKRCASLPTQKQRVMLDEKQNLKTQMENSSGPESLSKLNFENVSINLLKAWNNIYEDITNMDHVMETNSEILNDTKHNQTSLEEVFLRFGLQVKTAQKLAADAFQKLCRNRHDTISFDEFVSIIHCNEDSSVSTYRLHSSDKTNFGNLRSQCDIVDDISAINITDLHAQSGTTWLEETMTFDAVIDMLELSHIKDASGMLETLGFRSKEINISQLLAVLDDELQDDQQAEKSSMPLLEAAHALYKNGTVGLQKALQNSVQEKKQLEANIQEINRRAYVMAQEVDERHASLESTARAELRKLEQRHADIVREITAQLTTDREHWSQLNQKLEKRIKQLETEDTKNKQRINCLKDENSALEKEQMMLQTQVTELLETNIKLNNEIAEAEDHNGSDYKGIHETEEVLELMDKITKLQIENANLRDKNDELITEVEDLHVEISKMKTRKPLRFDNNNSSTEEGSSSGETVSNLATKRRGDSPSKAKFSEESPRLGKLRKCDNDNSETESEPSGDWLNCELNQAGIGKLSQTSGTTSGFSQESSSLNINKDDNIKTLKSRIEALEEELASLRKPTEKQTNNDLEKSVPESDKNGQGRIQELEASLEQMQKEYEACEDYWQGKLNEERQLYEEEQRINCEKFNELLKKMAEYEEQFSSSTEKDGRLSPIEEKQYAELLEETEEFRREAREMLNQKSMEISELQNKLKDLQERLCEQTDINLSTRSLNLTGESPASSPISYLWNQSTIQAPTRDYQNPNWSQSPRPRDNMIDRIVVEHQTTVSPIQRPQTPSYNKANNGEADGKENNNDQYEDNSSVHSYGTHSVASTHSIHRSLPETLNGSPNIMREDIKRLKHIELQLKDEIRGLAHQRDGLVMELQQLQEAKPVLAKAYARTPHPTIIQKIQQLEQKNRQLQFCLKQQQHYTESIMHQTWQQQRTEINELHATLEAQGIIINEQAQRLTNSDLLVKDLYVENSQLTAAIQRLEQQRSRNNILLQHQGMSSMPSML